MAGVTEVPQARASSLEQQHSLFLARIKGVRQTFELKCGVETGRLDYSHPDLRPRLVKPYSLEKQYGTCGKIKHEHLQTWHDFSLALRARDWDEASGVKCRWQ